MNLKNGKALYEQICWDRALVLWKKNLPGRGLTKVEKRCIRTRCCIPEDIHIPGHHFDGFTHHATLLILMTL